MKEDDMILNPPCKYVSRGTFEKAMREEDLETIVRISDGCKTYSNLIKIATHYGINLDHLEELLYRVS